MKDFKKLFLKETTIGRLEYIKLTYGLGIFISSLLILCSVIHTKYDVLFYILFVISGFAFLGYAIIKIFTIYKRLQNIFTNKYIIFPLLVVNILCSITNLFYIWYLPGTKLPVLLGFINAIFTLFLIICPGKKQRSKIISNTTFWLVSVISVLLILFIKLNGEIYYNASDAMNNTLQKYDRIYMDKHNKNYKRGDIVLYYPGFGKYNFIKRIIGTPKDKIEIKKESTSAYYIYVNNKKIEEKYVKDIYDYPECTDEKDFKNKQVMHCSPITLKNDEYYLIGDNRGNSFDSRYTGPVKYENIVGKATHIWFPLPRRKSLTD